VVLTEVDSSLDNLFHISGSSNLNLTDITGQNIENIVIYIDDSNITVIDNLMLQNVTQSLSIDYSTVEQITNSQFLENGNTTARYGGSISITDSDVSITNSTFNESTATNGAAISFKCSSTTLCGLYVSNSTFSNNAAETQGGAIYYNFIRPQMSNLIFSNNTAQYGQNIASYPVKIKLQNSDSDTIELNNIGSGIKLNETLTFELLDYDNQVMVLDNENSISIFASQGNNASVGGTNTVLLTTGVALFDSLIFISEPGSNDIDYYATSKAIDADTIQKAFGQSISNNTINVNFRY
jgi:hypothetical protein